MDWISVNEINDISDENNYTLSLKKNCCGWNTDSGYDGYGLPKELAEWIVEVLNQATEEQKKRCPYKMNKFGYWIKKV